MPEIEDGDACPSPERLDSFARIGLDPYEGWPGKAGEAARASQGRFALLAVIPKTQSSAPPNFARLLVETPEEAFARCEEEKWKLHVRWAYAQTESAGGLT